MARRGAPVLVIVLAIRTIGVTWLGQLSADSDYLTAIALPMMLIGAGQGGALGPVIAAGIAGVAPEDAGAASGVTSVAHQLGGSLGLGVLVAVFAAADSDTLTGAALLAVALILVATTIVARRAPAPALA